MNKVKILLFGPVLDQVEIFKKKLAALNASKAGPFDAAFVAGKTNVDLLKSITLPIPVFLQDPGIDLAPQTSNDHVGCYRVTDNLFVLRNPETPADAGIWDVPIGSQQLVIACLPTNLRIESNAIKSLMEKLNHVSYVGCDLLLSSEWPQGIEALLEVEESAPISFDVADVALRARARYHVAPGPVFSQSAAFSHLAAATSTTNQHSGRFVSLAPVSESPTKNTKFVHALGLQPLHSMSSAERIEASKSSLPCPFTDSAYQKDSLGKADGDTGLSEASARRILAEEQHKSHTQKWNKKPREEQEIDPSNTTLFVYGLHKDVTGQLQSPRSNVLILQAFPGAVQVRLPPTNGTSTFCFVDFSTHEEALQCWNTCDGEVMINGVSLNVKWATQSKPSGPPTKRSRITEAEAKDSTSLFYRLPGTFEDLQTAGEVLRRCMEKILEDALAGDGEERMTAEDEPALRVQAKVQDKNYGFLEFASHAAASMALATLTGSTDGGVVVQESTHLPKDFAGLVLNWSSGSHGQASQLIQDVSGFKFERKHFPADSRHDCWFCLASDTCEKHLITGVYDKCYMAMPKGPVHPGHVLLIPVQHSSQGALKDPSVSEEMEALKCKLRSHADMSYDKDIFVFERAIQTKGGYHTHVQCIPVPRQLGSKIEATMLAQARSNGMDMRQLKSDISLASILNDEDGYFYAEIPVAKSEPKRYLYRTNSNSSCPLQFGREIVAAVLAKPELAHWKSCVLEKEQEARVAADFRESFGHACEITP